STIFLVIVVLVAWYGRLAPGLLAALCATLAMDYFFIEPIYTLDLGSKVSSALIVFALSAIVVGWASANRRRAPDELKRARYETEQKVIERTVDLRRTNARLEAEIVERKLAQREVEHLAGRLIHAQEEERSRIGRELHDHISQMLGVLTIRLDQLRADDATPSAIAATLEQLRQSTAEITDDIHNLSHRLHSSALDYLGLVAALKRLVSEFSARHAIDIELSHAAIPEALPSDVAVCLFRVTEESLANVAKHSQSKTARVDVRGERDGIHLTIEDAGKGFD